MSAEGGPAVSQQMISFLEQEKKKAAVNELVAKVSLDWFSPSGTFRTDACPPIQLTSVCWDKCVSSPGKKLSYSEDSCLRNCAARFLESSQLLLQKFGERGQ
mmetsp:Transcript_9344/g.23981  ORF Transcript_9344/g.23981 Transcript_9344/m.23981 type:complete len:102 (+) Transcript_9344:100-405(+)